LHQLLITGEVVTKTMPRIRMSKIVAPTGLVTNQLLRAVAENFNSLPPSKTDFNASFEPSETSGLS
jgi:hypothetical protein